jgi:23S rRNA-intervening sequence protein
MSLGSLAEVAYLLLLAKDLNLLQEQEYQTIDDLRRRAGGLTWQLARGLRNQKD